MGGKAVSDQILSILLTAMERGGPQGASTVDVARRAGIAMDHMLHVLPVLIQRGHLDMAARTGMLKLSADGITAARALKP